MYNNYIGNSRIIIIILFFRKDKMQYKKEQHISLFYCALTHINKMFFFIFIDKIRIEKVQIILSL